MKKIESVKLGINEMARGWMGEEVQGAGDGDAEKTVRARNQKKRLGWGICTVEISDSVS